MIIILLIVCVSFVLSYHQGFLLCGQICFNYKYVNVSFLIYICSVHVVFAKLLESPDSDGDSDGF